MAIRILNSENITGTITGIGIYTAGNSVKIFEAQRSGGAVAGDWSYHDANTTMSFGTSTYHPLSIKTADTERIRVQNNGNIGINNNNPTEILDISDDDGDTNIRVSDNSANSEVGLKLKNDAKTWTLQNWGSGGDNLRLLNNAGNIVQLWDDNGNVMIGNANDPEKKLHILTSTTDHTPQVLIQNGSSGDASLTFNVSGQSYVIGIDHDDSSKFKIAASGNLGTNDRVTLLSSGNVGIGTISPSEKLHVVDTNAGVVRAPLRLQNEGTTTGTGVELYLTTKTSGGGNTTSILRSISTDTSGNCDMVLLTPYQGSASEKFRIGSSGIVYIMGATPSVNNSLQMQYNSTAGSAEIYAKSTSGNTHFEFYTSNAGSTTEKMRINNLGNVGIGTTNPTSISANTFSLSVGSVRNDLTGAIVYQANGTIKSQMYWDSAGLQTVVNSGDARWYTGGVNDRLRITSGGNVGIGVTSPSGKLEVAGGSTLGFRLSNVGDQSAYDQVRMTYSGYNSGSPTVTFMPLTTPGSGNAYTTFLFQNTNGINASSNNNANVAIDGTLQVGRSKGSGETTLIMNNYDTSLAGLNQIQNSIRMSGRYWSGSASQLVETRINSVHQESDGNGGSALTFMTQTGGSAVVEQMRIDKVGNVGIGETSPAEKLEVNGNIKAGDTTGKFFTNTYSFSGVVLVDFFQHTNAGIWEYTIKINPNTAGSGSYTDYYYGKVGVGIGWSGSNVTQYLWNQPTNTAPRTLYPSGGGNLGLSFQMLYSGSVYTDLPLNTGPWSLRLTGLGTSVSGEIFFRRLA